MLFLVAASAATPATVEDWSLRAAAAPGPVERKERRLASLGRCRDRRYPRLVGGFIIGCGRSGDPDLLLDLSTGERLRLEQSAPFAVGDGWLYALGRDGGWWRLPEAFPSGHADAVLDAIAPPASDGLRVAYVARDHASIFQTGSRSRPVFAANPLPWFPPALAGSWLIWTERNDGEFGLWGIRDQRGDAAPFARGSHPVGNGRWLAWVALGGDVVVADTAAEEMTRYPASSGFESAPVLMDPAQASVCFGDRDTGTFQVVCSDGWAGSGRRPSGAGPLLLAHDAVGPILYIAESWTTVSDGTVEVRAWWGEGEVSVRVDGVEVARLWMTPGEPIPLAVRPGWVELVPDEPVPAGLRH